VCNAEGQYSEENAGKLNPYKGTCVLDGRLQMQYQNNDLTALYRTSEEDAKGVSYFRVKQLLCSSTSKNVTALYRGQKCYGETDTYPVAVYKKQIYGVSYTKKKLVVTTYNQKMGEIANRTFSMNSFINKKNIGNKQYHFRCNEVKVLNVNQVQILYTVNRNNGESFYGGIAVLNLKTQTVSKNKTLSFAPLKSDSKYIYGKSWSEKAWTNTLYIAAKGTGKVLQSYRGDYGVDTSATYLFSGVDETEQGTYDYGLHRFDFKDGQILLLNYSGIYYGSVGATGLEKIMDIDQLPYYMTNLQKIGFYGVALNNKKEFAIAYSDNFDSPKFVFKKYVSN
jgi:hypothetical protein